MMVYVTVNEPAATGSLSNSAFVSGGGAAEAKTTAANPLGGPLPTFGCERLLRRHGPGRPDRLAGRRPPV